ncbi:hypothetical protein MYX65_00090 [Acidobacteria bacterium AH-259-L09]|nr:hypothetical protein [Acidobacteria bacterium AH-259-L09]
MYVEVPNLFVHKCFSIAHAYSFYTGTLRVMLESTGFRVIETAIHGRPSVPWIGYYISMLARPVSDAPYELSDSTFLTIRAVKHKRRLGRLIGVLPYLRGSVLKVLRRTMGTASYNRIRSFYWKYLDDK